jgi:hypothetical protein
MPSDIDIMIDVIAVSFTWREMRLKATVSSNEIIIFEQDEGVGRVWHRESIDGFPDSMYYLEVNLVAYLEEIFNDTNL